MANAPFNTIYKIPYGNDFVVVNGDHIVKFVVKEISPDVWQVTFKLSDGTEHVIGPNQWTKQFVAINRPT